MFWIRQFQSEFNPEDAGLAKSSLEVKALRRNDFKSDSLDPVVFETVDPSFFLEEFSLSSSIFLTLFILVSYLPCCCSSDLFAGSLFLNVRITWGLVIGLFLSV